MNYTDATIENLSYSPVWFLMSLARMVSLNEKTERWIWQALFLGA